MVTVTVRALPFVGVNTTPTRHVPAAVPATNFFVTVQAAPLVLVSRLTVEPFGTLTLNTERSVRNAIFCPTGNAGDEPAGVDTVVGTVVGTTVDAGGWVPAPGVVVDVSFAGFVDDDSPPAAGVPAPDTSATTAIGLLTVGGC